jgi:hypothetical protein
MQKGKVYLDFFGRLCAGNQAIFAQHKDKRNFEGQEGVAHPNTVAGPLTEHQQAELIWRIFRRKILRIEDQWILEVLLVSVSFFFLFKLWPVFS